MNLLWLHGSFFLRKPTDHWPAEQTMVFQREVTIDSAAVVMKTAPMPVEVSRFYNLKDWNVLVEQYCFCGFVKS